ncbi:MAG: hypothetical protein V4492_03220, partial [Chlamydiota bacterium]
MSSSLTSIGARCAEVHHALGAYTPGNETSLEHIHRELAALKEEIHFYEQISPSEVGISLYSKMVSTFEEMVNALPMTPHEQPRWGMIASDPVLRQMHADFRRGYDAEIVDKCFRYCAFLRHLDLVVSQPTCSSSPSTTALPYEEIYKELHFRIDKITEFTSLILTLFEEIRPSLPGSAETYRMIQGVAFSIYRYPVFYIQQPADNPERMRVENLIAFMRVLNESPMKDEDVAYLLRVGVNQYVQTVSSQDIEQGARLSQMHRRATYSYRAQTLVRGTTYSDTHTDKRMYLIADEIGSTIGKLKTFVPAVYHYNCPRHEALGYAYDQLLGAGMTCPTSVAAIFPSYEREVTNELRQIAGLLKMNRQEGKDQFAQLPIALKNAIYRCLYQLKHSSTADANCGQAAFWNEKGLSSTPEERAHAIEIFVELSRIVQLFRSVQFPVLDNREGKDLAAKDQFAHLPSNVKNAVYGCLFQVKSPAFSGLNYGEEAFKSENGLSSTPEERAQAIEMYLGDAFPYDSSERGGRNSG